jgi:ElaB/YqjD/DUF883 family membrane-anchored ribosome-binding protein
MKSTNRNRFLTRLLPAAKNAYAKPKKRVMLMQSLEDRRVMAASFGLESARAEGESAVSSLSTNLPQLQAVSFTNDEELLAALVDEALGQLGHISSAISDNLEPLGNVPAVGDELLAAIRPLVRGSLEWDAAQLQAANDTRAFLASRGIQINAVASAQDLFAGTHGDLIVLTLDRTENVLVQGSSTLTVQGAGELGPSDGIHLNFEGELTVQPTVHYQMTFGIDSDGRFFISEGAALQVALTADGELEGIASIPSLTDVTVTATSDQEYHLFQAAVDFLVSDFDAVPNERFFLDNASDVALSDLLMNEQAFDFTSSFDADVAFSLDNPLSHLPSFLANPLAGLFPSQLTWIADVSMDGDLGDLEVEIRETSISQIASLLASHDSLQDALFQYMIDQVAAHNPLPDSVQQLLATDIPILNQNLLDLLDVPASAQFLIAPEAFRGKPLAEVASDDDGNRLEFGFELFKPENLLRLLSGQSYEILSIDLEQRFQSDGTPITVMPETVLFSYLGIANVTMEVNLLPSIFFEFDLGMGLDSEGFYIEGATAGGAGADPNITFGGGIAGQIVGEGDLFFVLDLVRVTAEIGIEAFGGFTFITDSASDEKIRNLTPDNILVTAGIDLNVGLKGEVGLLNFGIQRSVERSIERPLYRYSAGTLGDIQDQLDAFKQQFRREGKLAVYAAAPLDPHITAVAAVLLYEDLGSVAGTAKALIQDLRVNLVTAVKSLRTELNVGIRDLAKILKNEIGTPIVDIGKLLVRELNVGIAETVRILKQEVSASTNDIARLLKELGSSVQEIGRMLFEQANATLQEAAAALGNLTRNAQDIAAALNAKAGATLTQIADVMYRNIPWTSVNDVASGLGAVSRDANAIASAISSKVTSNLNSIAQAMWSISWTSHRDIAVGLGSVSRNASAIASAISSQVTSNLNSIAKAMWSISWTSHRDIAVGLGSVSRNASAIASAISSQVTSNLNSIAKAMWSISWTSSRDIAVGLGSVSRHVNGIATALRNNVTSSLNTIASSMWAISWTSKGQIAQGLGSVSRDASAIARTLSSQLSMSHRDIASVMYRNIQWTSVNDVANGLGALTRNMSAVADALRNGAGASAASVQNAVSSVSRALGIPSGGSVSLGGVRIRW